MISFACDYSEGCHPKILEALIKSNYEQLPGYGFDDYAVLAKQKIKEACKQADAEVFFLVGGTQTNQVVIDAILKPYEGILTLDSGHIAQYEAGAIEYTGHKILRIEGENGKMQAPKIAEYCQNFYADSHQKHMVQPGAVFLTFPTEVGTIYSKQELMDIYETAHQYHLAVYLDGARLGYGLMSEECDVSLADIAKYTDAFYIGGTKLGALCGEAVVFSKGNSPEFFFTHVKQHGALLAKGRLLSIQYDVLFTDNLYFHIARHANAMAKKLKEGFMAKGYSFRFSSSTNQQFVIMSEEDEKVLRQRGFCFSHWEKLGNGSDVWRFVTSWATSEKQVEELLAALPDKR